MGSCFNSTQRPTGCCSASFYYKGKARTHLSIAVFVPLVDHNDRFFRFCLTAIGGVLTNQPSENISNVDVAFKINGYFCPNWNTLSNNLFEWRSNKKITRYSAHYQRIVFTALTQQNIHFPCSDFDMLFIP